jgi:hypothetical protein
MAKEIEFNIKFTCLNESVVDYEVELSSHIF